MTKGGVADGSGVEGDGGNQDSLEQDLSNNLTGGSLAKQGVGDVVGDAALLRDGSGVDLPVAAGELIVLVVADGTQDHGQGLVAGDLPVGVKDLVAAALDVAGVGAVVDVPGVPGAVSHVGEQAPGGVDVLLGVAHVASGDAIDDGRDFGTSDVALGLKSRAIVVALENFQTVQDSDSIGILVADLILVREVRGAGGGHEGKAHNQGQYQGENLLEISHGGSFLLF